MMTFRTGLKKSKSRSVRAKGPQMCHAHDKQKQQVHHMDLRDGDMNINGMTDTCIAVVTDKPEFLGKERRRPFTDHRQTFRSLMRGPI